MNSSDVVLVLLVVGSFLSLIIGGSLLLGSLFSFNNHFHQQRGENTTSAALGTWGLIKLVLGTVIALYSIVIYWRSNREGRLTLISGLILTSFGVAVIWAAGHFDW